MSCCTTTRVFALIPSAFPWSHSQAKKRVFLLFGCAPMDELYSALIFFGFDTSIGLERSHANSSRNGDVTTGVLMWRLRTGLSTAAGLCRRNPGYWRHLHSTWPVRKKLCLACMDTRHYHGSVGKMKDPCGETVSGLRHYIGSRIHVVPLKPSSRGLSTLHVPPVWIAASSVGSFEPRAFYACG